MKKLRLLSAAALSVMMVAEAPAMTSQAAMFTTCVPGNSSGIIFNSGMLSGGFGQRGGNCQSGSNCQNGTDCFGGNCQNGTDCLGGNCQSGNDCFGGSCQSGNDCFGGSCQNGNTGAGWQNGIQTLPSFGGMPVASMQGSCR